MPASFSCQRSIVPFNCFRSERLRARRSAGSVWSRRSDLKTDNKKPGVERRATPSIPRGIQADPWDGLARSSISFYPVFVTNLTSTISRQARSVSRPPDKSGHRQHQESISGFFLSSSLRKQFYRVISVCAPVNFTSVCGNLGTVRSPPGQVRKNHRLSYCCCCGCESACWFFFATSALVGSADTLAPGFS
jgi:hypothetical protein